MTDEPTFHTGRPDGSRIRKPVPLTAGDLSGVRPTDGLETLVSLPEAREMHQRLFGELIRSHTLGPTLLRSPTGTGKTAGLARACCDLMRRGWPEVTSMQGVARPLRLVVLTKTAEAAEAFVAEMNDLAMLVRGRQPDPGDPFGCLLHAQINLTARMRQDVGAICRGCLVQHRGRHGSSWSCAYLRSRAKASKAQVVAAPIAAFLNDSGAVAELDIVVVDEELLPTLLETIRLTDNHLQNWRHRAEELRMRQRDALSPDVGLDPGWTLLFDALGALLMNPRRPHGGA